MPKTGWKYTKKTPDKGTTNMIHRSKASSKLGRKPTHAGMRSSETINRLKMYNNGKAVRNKEGTLVGGQFMMKDRAGDREITAGKNIIHYLTGNAVSPVILFAISCHLLHMFWNAWSLYC
jgi:hypothetical protein